jgi:hypothetical protein
MELDSYRLTLEYEYYGISPGSNRKTVTIIGGFQDFKDSVISKWKETGHQELVLATQAHPRTPDHA